MAVKAKQQYYADETTIKKEAREFGMIDELKDKLDSIEYGAQVNIIEEVQENGVPLEIVDKSVNVLVPEVIDNLYTIDPNNSLSAKQGKILYDMIKNLLARGRFLSTWNTATGLPVTNPEESPYPYKAGDYYIVGIVAAEGGTNFRPEPGEYVINVASDEQETSEVHVSDIYVYDGENWILLINSTREIAIDDYVDHTYQSTNPVENQAIAREIDTKQNKFYTVSTTSPSNPSEGDEWYDATNDKVFYWDGTQWKEMGGGGETYTAGLHISIDPNDNNKISVVEWSATSSALGLVKLGSDTRQTTTPNSVTSTANRTYRIQTNSNGQLLVNVPWTDTTYTAGDGISIDTSNNNRISCTVKPVTVGPTAPATPGTGDLWYDTTKNTMFLYKNNSWTIIGPEIYPITKADYEALTPAEQGDGRFFLITDNDGTIYVDWDNVQNRPMYIGATAPSNPCEGYIWYDTTNDVLKVYDGTQWNEVGGGGGGCCYTAGNGIDITNDEISIDTTVVATKTDLNSKQDAFHTTSSTAPSNPSEGDEWYDSTNDVLKVYDGTNWIVTGKTYTAGTNIDITNDVISADTQFVVVDTLPAIATADANKVYILGPIGSGADKYEEYIVQDAVEGHFESASEITHVFAEFDSTSYSEGYTFWNGDNTLTNKSIAFDNLTISGDVDYIHVGDAGSSDDVETVDSEETPYVYYKYWATPTTKIAEHPFASVRENTTGSVDIYYSDSDISWVEGTPKQYVKIGETSPDLSGKQDKATSGSGAPSTTPSYIGQMYVDTANDNLYVATGTSSSSDWTAVDTNTTYTAGDGIDITNSEISVDDTVMQYPDYYWASKTGASVTLDFNSTITPSANFTVNAPSTIEDGQTYILRVVNGNTAYTMSLGTNVTNPHGSDLTLEAGTVQQFVFLAVGGNLELQAEMQEKLVSGTNIKTVNNNSLLGSGNINIPSGKNDIVVDPPTTPTDDTVIWYKIEASQDSYLRHFKYYDGYAWAEVERIWYDSSSPSTYNVGDLWYDTNYNVLKYYDASSSAWKQVGGIVESAGNGIDINNGEISVDVDDLAGYGLTAGNDNLEIDWTYVQEKLNEGDGIDITGGTTISVDASDLAGTGLSTDNNNNLIVDTTVVALKTDLANYYTKTETYTKTEVDNLISSFGNFEVVASLPSVSTASTKTIYLLGPIGTGADKYEEWIVTETNQWSSASTVNHDSVSGEAHYGNRETIWNNSGTTNNVYVGIDNLVVTNVSEPSSRFIEISESDSVGSGTEIQNGDPMPWISQNSYTTPVLSILNDMMTTTASCDVYYSASQLTYGPVKQWTKIGETSIDLSGYATTTALTNGLATKQDTLTAGDGIDITNNEISVDVTDIIGTGLTEDASNNIIIDTTVVATQTDLSGKQDKATSGSTAPSTTPSYVGQQYIDTTNDKMYVATGTTSSSDWTEVGAGSGDMLYSDFGWETLTGASVTLALRGEIEPSANFTVNKPNDLKDGQFYVLRVVSGATAYTMTLGTDVTNPYSEDLTLSANTIAHFTFLAKDGELELQPSTEIDISGKQDKATSGSTAPSTTPSYIGQQYVDTTNDKLYVATGTSSSSDWMEVGAGSGDMLYADFNWVSKTGATVTLDINSTITPSANFTVNAPATIKDGQIYILRVVNGATAYTMTLGTGITNPYSTSTTLTANGVDQFVFQAIGGNLELLPDSEIDISGKQDKATSGSTAPSTTPTYVGQQYVDTTNDILYIATGTSSSSDWKEVGGGNVIAMTQSEYNALSTAEKNDGKLRIITDAPTEDISVDWTNVANKPIDISTQTGALSSVKIWVGTQTAYDNLGSYDANTLYFTTNVVSGS